MEFDPSAAQSRIQRLWSHPAHFGMERAAYYTYLNEIVSNRYVLVNGMQLLRDELQLTRGEGPGIEACGADLSQPSVMSTLAHTNCGDRIHQNEATEAYDRVVSSRFAFMSEIGGLKLEAFSPAGGGTDDGATLAHVTVSHQIDDEIRRRLYQGNARSFFLASVDLQTHVGRCEDEEGTTSFGRTREAPWRKPRAACGAVVGALRQFHENNGVHRRIRRDLGPENYALLSAEGSIRGDEGLDLAPVVAASIVAVQGMINTLRAFAFELDERGVAHATASLAVNRVSRNDTVIYLARGTLFGGEIRVQGFGTDARKYGGRLEKHEDDQRLVLTYDGHAGTDFPVQVTSYEVQHGEPVLSDDVIEI